MRSRKKKQSSPLVPVLMILAGVLLIAAVLIFAALRNPGGQQAGAPDSTGVERVTLQESKAALDGNTAVFLDVRGADQYASGHIPGAVNIPLNELDARLNELDPNAWIITYCT